jgi:hypothetical protein
MPPLTLDEAKTRLLEHQYLIGQPFSSDIPDSTIDYIVVAPIIQMDLASSGSILKYIRTLSSLWRNAPIIKTICCYWLLAGIAKQINFIFLNSITSKKRSE